MSEFSLNTNFNFDYKMLAEISEDIYPDITKLVYTGMSFNSELDDVLFLNNYFTQVFTKYYTILEYLGFFENRNSVQKYVDSSSAVIATTMEYFYKTDINEAIRFFVNQFLKLVYDESEFSIINIKLNSGAQKHSYKIVIEPISIYGDDICDSNDAEQLCELMILLLSYLESPDRCVSIGLIRSNLWSDYDEKFPEIIDDNIFAGLFENYPAIYKILFKSRHKMLEDIGINLDYDLSEEIVLDKEAEQMYNNITKASSGQEENSNIINVYEEIIEYSKIINYIYNKIVNKNKQLATSIKIEDLNLNHTIDMPVYMEILKRFKEEKFNSWTIQRLIKKEYGYYENIEEDEGDFLNEDERNSLMDLLDDLKNEADVDLNIEYDEENKTFVNKNIENNTTIPAENDSNFTTFNNFKISETNPTEKNKDGYQKFIPDYHTANETRLIYDLKDYIGSTLNIYINNNGKINAPLIKKVVKSYNNSCDIEIININNDKNQYIMEIKEDTLENKFRFTISKEDGKIKYIENKKD